MFICKNNCSINWKNIHVYFAYDNLQSKPGDVNFVNPKKF